MERPCAISTKHNTINNDNNNNNNNHNSNSDGKTDMLTTALVLMLLLIVILLIILIIVWPRGAHSCHLGLCKQASWRMAGIMIYVAPCRTGTLIYVVAVIVYGPCN